MTARRSRGQPPPERRPGPDPRQRLGRWGEELAACFLRGLGCEILGRNVRVGPLELDLLVRDEGVVAIVEVRLRSDLSRGRPEESVAWRKRRHLERAWREVVVRYPEARWIRMDIVSILVRGRRAVEIRHFPHAWMPRGLGPF